MKIIRSLSIEDNELIIKFKKENKIILHDAGQSCCETRYMTCDDNLDYYVGAEYYDWEVRDAPNIQDDCEVHNVQFLIINTSRGSFTVANHNEHNGYYGGFNIVNLNE